jgi:hypothetical protein
MLAHKLLLTNSDIPTRPINDPPLPAEGAGQGARTHLMLVRTPKATPRALAWARAKDAEAFDALRLQSMLRSERLNLG